MKIPRASIAFIAVAFLLTSCDEHVHDDPSPEPHTARLTLWESGLELFVEYEYAVAGSPVRFIIHVSELSTGEPWREGAIFLELADPAGGSREHAEESPARNGIYLPSITFPSAGVWKVLVRVPTSSGEKRIRFPDLMVYESPAAAQSAPPQEEPEGVSFLKEQQWKLSMVTATASKKTLGARRKFPGHVMEKVGHRVSVSSAVAGRLVAPGGTDFPNRGRVVREGEVLALVEPTLPSSELLSLAVKLAEAEAEEFQAAHALKLSNATLARVTRLQQSNAKSTRELEKAQFEAQTAKTAHEAAVAIKERYENARAYTSFSRPLTNTDAGSFGPLSLRAPISGTVVRVNTAPGEQVTPQKALFVVLDSSTVSVEARVPQYEAGALGTRPKAFLKLRADDEGESKRLSLLLLYSGLEVEKETRTVPLLYEADNSGGLLRVGMSVNVFVEIGAPREAIAVAESALVDEDGRYIVFVQLSGETFEKRVLTLGVRDGDLVEVLDGLAEGERVVTSDAWSIRLASLSTVIPDHGHEH